MGSSLPLAERPCGSSALLRKRSVVGECEGGHAGAVPRGSQGRRRGARGAFPHGRAGDGDGARHCEPRPRGWSGEAVSDGPSLEG